MRLPLPLLIGVALLAGCQRRPDDVPVVVSAIGENVDIADPTRAPLSHPEALLLDAAAQGLVRFDANGQVEPGLAARWIVIDEGRSYIFRLRDAEWPDGSAVTAAQVVRSLRQTLRRSERTRLSPHLAVIDEVVEMTPEVIEVRLRQPRPDLLVLFAQPELAVLDPRGRLRGGTGPLRRVADDAPGLLLRPATDPGRPADAAVEETDPAQFVRLLGERAALAIARFAERRSDLVSGGTFRDWPLLEHAEVAPPNRRIDPANGLFGLAVVSRDGFLADAANREAVAMAIDRVALTAAFLNDWTPRETVLPDQVDSAAPPVRPGWTAFDIVDRRAAAAVRVTAWRGANGDERPVLRVALPDGPGARLLWAHVAAGLRAIGVQPERVGWDADAELRLVDRVAPYDSARWYLVNACQPCGNGVAELLLAARDAPDLPTRRERLADADAALAEDIAFIPIARPLRWSLVALRLREWRENGRAWHPLNRLRREPNS